MHKKGMKALCSNMHMLKALEKKIQWYNATVLSLKSLDFGKLINTFPQKKNLQV